VVWPPPTGVYPEPVEGVTYHSVSLWHTSPKFQRAKFGGGRAMGVFRYRKGKKSDS